MKGTWLSDCYNAPIAVEMYRWKYNERTTQTTKSLDQIQTIARRQRAGFGSNSPRSVTAVLVLSGVRSTVATEAMLLALNSAEARRKTIWSRHLLEPSNHSQKQEKPIVNLMLSHLI